MQKAVVFSFVLESYGFGIALPTLLTLRFGTNTVQVDGLSPFDNGLIESPSLFGLLLSGLSRDGIEEYLLRITLRVAFEQSVIGIVISILPVVEYIIARSEIVIESGCRRILRCGAGQHTEYDSYRDEQIEYEEV